ncbi:MAG TPA: ATP-binding protein [Pirellulales bacterium]|jgi:PAS domain S-box-containing protein|nr:ATP-binding protein [Pirellulales bacterium]
MVPKLTLPPALPVQEPQTLEEAESLLSQLAQAFVIPSAAMQPLGGEKNQADVPHAAIERLKYSEARYRTLVEQIPAITFMASLDGGVDENEIYVSPHIETMLGFTQEEWLGDPFLWYRQLHPDDRQRWGAEFARTCASGVGFSSEYRFISRDNREVWVHGEARVVRDETGRPLFLQGIAFDITESKRAEQALRRSAEELEDKVQQRTAALEEASLRAELASRARASFLANMSHEIRTPLNAIIGFADLLRRGADSSDDERMEWLEIIRTGGMHLLALINDILDLSKVDAGKLDVEDVVCSPVKLIEEVGSILRPKAVEKGLELRTAFDGPMPETIHTDPTRFRQVLINIAGNAIKFTPSGHVEITARLDRPAGEPAKLVVQIADTGIGIPPEKLGVIFDPFTQADSSITRQFGGTGLGLAISRRLAEMLGGRISVESQVGRGTTFTCEIAVGSLEGVRLLDQLAGMLGSQASLPRAHATPVLNHRLLVVDDGDTNRKLVQLVLGRAGARVEAAENGQQAVARATTEPFDLILMDMQMPVMDGYTATAELRARGVTVPIIALTANAMKWDEDRCLEAGCSGYLSKPIDQDLLLVTVAAALGATNVPPPTPTVATSATTPPAAVAPPVKQGRLLSTLATEDPDFRDVVAHFAERLQEKLPLMHEHLAAGDLPGLAGLAHWLKGTGGTAGFPAFTQPAVHLEQLARSGRAEGIHEAIERLEQIAAQIVIE